MSLLRNQELLLKVASRLQPRPVGQPCQEPVRGITRDRLSSDSCPCHFTTLQTLEGAHEAADHLDGQLNEHQLAHPQPVQIERSGTSL